MWEIAKEHPAIYQNTIHVWRLALDVDERTIAKYRALLSADEVVQADKYYFDRDRRKYTVARGSLRTLLARYSGAPDEAARDFVFAYGEHGKPSLAGNAHLNFNISHSGEVALLAFTQNQIALGVDVERVRADIDLPGMARISFSPAERAALFALPAAEQLRAFYALWTRKEAYIKAIGLGLAMPLSGFTVSCTSEAKLMRLESDAAEAAHWTMWSFDAGGEYPCALAARGRELAVRYFVAGAS